MRVLGYLFIAVGLLFCLTVLFMGLGLPMVGIGALLVIAGRDEKPARVGHAVNTALDIAAGMILMGVVIVGIEHYVNSRSASPPAPAAPSSQPARPKPAKKRAAPTASPARSSATP